MSERMLVTEARTPKMLRLTALQSGFLPDKTLPKAAKAAAFNKDAKASIMLMDYLQPQQKCLYERTNIEEDRKSFQKKLGH